MSFTVTANIQLAFGLCPLAAVHVTVVVPFGNAYEPFNVEPVVDPMVVGPGIVHVIVGVGQPVAVIAKGLVAVHTPWSVLVVMSALHVIVGGVTAGVVVELAGPATSGSSVIVEAT